MPEENVVLVEVEDRPLVEVGLPTTMKRVVVRRLQDRVKVEVTPKEDCHTREEEVMAEAEEMPISVTSVTSGDTGPLNVEKMNKLGRREHISLSPMKQRHYHRRWKICQRLGKPWC